MPNASDRILTIAKSRAVARSVEAQVARYQESAEFFRRLTALDEHSLGPELARLQNVPTTVPPHPYGLRKRLRSCLITAISPLLGRLLRAASLASPYHAAYELAVQMQARQLETEERICAELAALSSRIDELESEMNPSRRTA